MSERRAPELPPASAIRRDLAPADRFSSRPIFALIGQVLPTVESELVAGLLEETALLLVERDEEVRALQEVLSAAMTHAHAQHTTINQQRQRVTRLRETAREGRPPREYSRGRPCSHSIYAGSDRTRERARHDAHR